MTIGRHNMSQAITGVYDCTIPRKSVPPIRKQDSRLVIRQIVDIIGS